MEELITHIEELDYDIKMIDIEVNGNHLFFANNILTHNSNSDIEITDTSESFGLPATADLMIAFIRTEQLDKMGQIMVKQLKNRYNDPTTNRRFTIGIDLPKMRLYDIADPMSGITDDSDSSPVVSTPFSSQRKKRDYSGITV